MSFLTHKKVQIFILITNDKIVIFAKKNAGTMFSLLGFFIDFAKLQ